LLAIGYGRRSIEHRIARGRLFPVTQGIYAVGWPALNRKRRWMAAVLVGGEGAALSHGSAAALWEIGEGRSGPIAVSVRRRCELRRPGLEIHGRPSMAAEDIVIRDDIPVTSPVRTLVDLATEFEPIALERAINDADKRDLIDPDALREELKRFRGEPGARPLRQLLDKLSFRLSDSELGLVVETDGLRCRSATDFDPTPLGQKSDASRRRRRPCIHRRPRAWRRRPRRSRRWL
jgi:hypothetical protein